MSSGALLSDTRQRQFVLGGGLELRSSCLQEVTRSGVSAVAWTVKARVPASSSLPVRPVGSFGVADQDSRRGWRTWREVEWYPALTFCL